MANANVSKIGINSAVAAEEKAADEAAPVVAKAPVEVPPNISERRVVGVVEYPAPNGTKLVVTNL